MVFIIFAIPCQLFAQNDSYKIQKKYDEFNKTTSIKLKPMLIYFNDYPRIKLNLSITKFINDDSTNFNSLSISYLGDDWIFINSKRCLIFLIDGHRNILSPDYQNRRVLGPDLVYEYIAFNISNAQIRQISNAKQIKFRLRGQNGNITSVIPIKILGNIHRFYKEYWK